MSTRREKEGENCCKVVKERRQAPRRTPTSAGSFRVTRSRFPYFHSRYAVMRPFVLSLLVLTFSAHLVLARQLGEDTTVQEASQASEPVVIGPTVDLTSPLAVIRLPEPSTLRQTLPINLATALCLSQARPLVIASAQASVEEAAAQFQGAKVLWLPDLHVGTCYSHHDGATQATEGDVDFASFGSVYSGGGATLDFGVTDAIFQPLAACQELRARQMDVQTARNDALLAVAESYFSVQEARGRLAGLEDSVSKAEELLGRVEALSIGLVPEVETDRARALLADLNQQAISTRIAWNVASARLTRTLRLNPSAVVVPLEPPHLQVTLISAQYAVDDLIPCGLTHRPELASQKAVVQQTLELLRQERVRPLVPSVVLAGRGPDGSLIGGSYGGGSGGDLSTGGGRAEFDAELVWTLRNLGVGNRALVRGRAANQNKATIELCNLEDRVAEEVVEAYAEVEGTRARISEAETGVKEARLTFIGTFNGLGPVRGAGDQLQVVSRPQEAVAAIQQLNRAYDQYYVAINHYNQAQFRLYHALGYPSRILAWERRPGDIQQVDASRPPEMAPAARMSSNPAAAARRY
jgi:outer membrane protein TolC